MLIERTKGFLKKKITSTYNSINYVFIIYPLIQPNAPPFFGSKDLTPHQTEQASIENLSCIMQVNQVEESHNMT